MIKYKLKIETTTNGKHHWVTLPETHNRLSSIHIDKYIYKNLQQAEEIYKKDYRILFSNITEIHNYCKNYLKKDYEIILYQDKTNYIKEVVISEIKTYIMKDCNTGLYKIGKSINPKLREKTLQSEKPSIKIIKVFDKNIERTLHINYKDFRVRGEWFRLNKIQIHYICTHY